MKKLARTALTAAIVAGGSGAGYVAVAPAADAASCVQTWVGPNRSFEGAHNNCGKTIRIKGQMKVYLQTGFTWTYVNAPYQDSCITIYNGQTKRLYDAGTWSTWTGQVYLSQATYGWANC
ncbi:hypothetical protein [Flexivirga meconopsidis]|uniref:hypothetical protein n=1 Tax=Flexivirga meconopsidis TaxID=2977121 RepID=UPI0022406477|nr:hypothetical protein [Flexivirga meconopsidis]